MEFDMMDNPEFKDDWIEFLFKVNLTSFWNVNLLIND